MPGLCQLADDHYRTAQPGPGDQAAEQAGQPIWANRLPYRAVNTDPVSVQLVPAAVWSACWARTPTRPAVDPAP
jgi:hypothetical protein